MAWLTCIEAMFARYKQVRLLGNDVALIGFDLRHHDVVAVCQWQAQSTRDLGLHELTPVERLWLKAWQRFSGNAAA